MTAGAAPVAIAHLIMVFPALCIPALAAKDTSYQDVNTQVSSKAREKYTRKKGSGSSSSSSWMIRLYSAMLIISL